MHRRSRSGGAHHGTCAIPIQGESVICLLHFAVLSLFRRRRFRFAPCFVYWPRGGSCQHASPVCTGSKSTPVVYFGWLGRIDFPMATTWFLIFWSRTKAGCSPYAIRHTVRSADNILFAPLSDTAFTPATLQSTTSVREALPVCPRSRR